jgi:predicted Zn-dependent protease
MKRIAIGATMALLAMGCSVSTQQEVELGANYASQINAQLPIVQDPEVNRYINVLGDSIAKLSDDRSLDWHFYVVDSREVNAFAVPGGYVYVNRGLIERAGSLSELAGVLGHEIAHVTERHSIQQMQKAQTANVGVTLACVLTNVCNSQATGALVNLAGGAVFAKFSRDDEAEADQKAIEYTVRADISPNGIWQMFERLLEERRTRPDAVSGFFSTHPLEEDRIAATRATISRIDPAILRGLTVDTPNFETFKRRVASLPAPKG